MCGYFFNPAHLRPLESNIVYVKFIPKFHFLAHSLPWVPSTNETHPAENLRRRASKSAESGHEARKSLRASSCGRNSASCCWIWVASRHGVPGKSNISALLFFYLLVKITFAVNGHLKVKTPSAREKSADRSLLDF